MARTVSLSGFSRRSMPRISAPIFLVSGTTSNGAFMAIESRLATGVCVERDMGGLRIAEFFGHSVSRHNMWDSPRCATSP
jgi:hypothetical protein